MISKILRSKAVLVIFLASAMLSFGQIAYAQGRWSFEFRPGVNFATKKLGDSDLKTGIGFEGVFAYRFMDHLSIYAGWSWNKFGSDQSLAGTQLDFEETGYTYGLQFIHPIGESKINFLARAGAVSNHLEIEQDDEIIADSGHGFGWQIEGGLVVVLSDKWRLLPSVRYRSLSRDLRIQAVNTPVDMNYLSIGVGISRTF